MTAAFALALGQVTSSANAQSSSPASVTGKVTSAEEGAMEGVVVRAKKGIVTVSVVSNARGEFRFPSAKLGTGTYEVSIKAAGYDLDGPKSVTVADNAPANLDVKLVKTKNLAAQLSNQEWIMSVPGDDSQKRALTGCTNCHTVERILMSTHNAEQMLATIQRMAQ